MVKHFTNKAMSKNRINKFKFAKFATNSQI